MSAECEQLHWIEKSEVDSLSNDGVVNVVVLIAASATTQ